MKRRTCLKLEDKLKVIQYMERGRPVNDITRELGIGKTQVYKLYIRYLRALESPAYLIIPRK